MNKLFNRSNIKNYLSLNKYFKEEDTRFVLFCALKICAVSMIVFCIISYIIWVFLSFNNIFFEANGFPVDSDLRQAFFDSILTTTISRLQTFLVLQIILFALGVYVGHILLRPFKIIGTYCNEAIKKPGVEYNQDAFSDLRLLTRFSEFFFQYILDCRRKKDLGTNSIPPQYQRVRKPVFDHIFFFHFLLIIIVIAIAASYIITMIADDVYEGTISLALKTLSVEKNPIRYFLQNQLSLFNSLTVVTLISVFTSYIFLAFHLYSKVAGPAFGFFTTMRSYMKGNHFSRVHLLGFSHIRPYSRMFNKYLDYVDKEISEQDEKTSNK